MTHSILIGARPLLLSLIALLPLQSTMADSIGNEQALPLSDQNSLALNDFDPGHSTTLDRVTEQVLNAMLSGNWVLATESAEQLVDAFPDYALGHLMLAEAHTVTASAEPLISDLPSFSKELIDLLLEARARVTKENDLGITLKINNNFIPNELIQVGNHIDHVVLVDLESSDLYLFDTTTPTPKLLKKHYISSGEAGFGKSLEGDLKTPLGIYRINGFRSDDSLPALYGSGALMLDYPNALDRSLGKTGHGIWLHGNPPTNRSRSPRSSEGCVTMANDHLLDLYKQIDLSRTHVVLSNNVQWQNDIEMAIEKDRLLELFTQYRRAWLSNNLNDLAAIYSPKALPNAVRQASGNNIRKVATRQQTNLLAPNGISLDALANVQTDEISIMLVPNEHADAAHQHFLMEFELPNSSKPRVTLYWEKNVSGFWQIRREQSKIDGV